MHFPWAFTFVIDLYTFDDENEIKWDMYAALFRIFGVLMIVMDMKSEKIILRNSSVISP